MEIQGTLYRELKFNKSNVDADRRTVRVSFSSTEPYERVFGVEILSHADGAVNLSRLNDGGPVLKGHDSGLQIGVVERAWIDGQKGRALLRFSKNPTANEVFQDIQDGIIRNISVGYVVDQYQEKELPSGARLFEAIKWQPLEISVVAVPADNTVGIGRAYTGGKKMSEKDSNITVLRDGVETERHRVREILAFGKEFGMNEMARKAVAEGMPLEEFKNQLLKSLPEVEEVDTTGGEIGLSRREVSQYRTVDAIRSLADPNFARTTAGGLVIEASQAVAKRIGREPKGLFIPEDVLRRDLTVGTDTAGGYLVGTDHLAAEFTDVLRNRLVVAQAGARIIDGLVGDVAIPRKTASATAYWIAGDGADTITESQPTLGSISMSPHTVAGFTEFSHKLLVQSAPGIENLVRQDLADTLAVAIDLAALVGSGSSNQPTGILNTTGIGSNTYSNGGSPSWDDILTLEADLAGNNADSRNCSYLAPSAMRKVLKGIFTNSTYGEIPVWQPTPGDADRMNGYRAFSTEQMTAGYILLGDFSQLIIGRWNAIEVQADPYSKFTSGTVGVRALADIDIAVRYATAFSELHEAAS